MRDRARIKGAGGSGGGGVTYFTVFVLTVATLWLMFQVYTRKIAPSADGSSHPLVSRLGMTKGNAPSKFEFGEELEEDNVDGQEEEEGEEAAGNKTQATQPSARAMRNNANFKAQVASLLAIPVPIVLSQQSVNSRMDFSCGGSHVVKLRAYEEIKRQKHVEEALPEYDMFYASRNDKIFNRCAVVGNSGSMLESEHGHEIDQHDVIIRFNSGITQGYEQFVGSKTTFRILNNPDSSAKEKGEVTISTLRDDDIHKWALAVLNSGRKDEALCTDPEFLCYAWQWVRNTGHKPSTGLVGLVLALKVCRNTTMYGFQSKNYFSRTSRPHYYDWERPAKGRERVHPFAREVALYKQLHNTGFINMVTD